MGPQRVGFVRRLCSSFRTAVDGAAANAGHDAVPPWLRFPRGGAGPPGPRPTGSDHPSQSGSNMPFSAARPARGPCPCAKPRPVSVWMGEQDACLAQHCIQGAMLRSSGMSHDGATVLRAGIAAPKTALMDIPAGTAACRSCMQCLARHRPSPINTLNRRGFRQGQERGQALRRLNGMLLPDWLMVTTCGRVLADLHTARETQPRRNGIVTRRCSCRRQLPFGNCCRGV